VEVLHDQPNRTAAVVDPGLGQVLRATQGASPAELPDRERDVLYLRFTHDLTQSEIAHRIGVSQMQVSRVLRRALTRLSEQADDRSRREGSQGYSPAPWGSAGE
jgi:RNA polymerase sigma-B factor